MEDVCQRTGFNNVDYILISYKFILLNFCLLSLFSSFSPCPSSFSSPSFLPSFSSSLCVHMHDAFLPWYHCRRQRSTDFRHFSSFIWISGIGKWSLGFWISAQLVESSQLTRILLKSAQSPLMKNKDKNSLNCGRKVR